MKKKILLSPLLIIVLIVLFGVGVAGAAIYFGGSGGTGDISLQKGLVGQWKMDGNAKDNTPYTNDGTVTGAVLTTDRKGTVNKSYIFDGNDYIEIAANANYVFSGDMAISLWVNTEVLDGNYSNIFDSGVSGGSHQNFMEINPNGTFYWQTAGNLLTSATVLSINTWYHVVLTRSGGVKYLYINGVQDANTSSYGAQITNPEAWWIGKGHWAGGYPMKGKVDDFRIYNRALSSAEITALYQSYDPSVQISDLQKGLVGQWKLDGNMKDNAPYANNGSVGGGSPTLTTDRKGTANKAYSFAETTDYINVGNPSILRISSNITVSFWYKPTVVGATTYYPITKAVPGNQDFQFNSDTTKLNVVTGNGSAVSPLGTALTAGLWYHIVWTYNSSSGGLLYENAVSQGGGTGSGALTTTNSFHIGGTLYDGGYGAYGVLDDVRIYNRVLSQAEITALYQEYDPGIVVSDLQKGLIGQWKFDGNAKDNTPNTNDGTLTGATLTTDRKGTANKAYSFNGTSDYVGLPTNAFDSNTKGTLAMWIYPKALSSAFFGLGPSAAESPYWYFYTSDVSGYGGASQSVMFEMYVDGTHRYAVLPTSASVPLNAWTHIAYVVGGAYPIIYINGAAVAITEVWNWGLGGNPAWWFANFASQTSKYAIGVLDRLTPGGYFNGFIDDVRIYNRALSPTEITALYESY